MGMGRNNKNAINKLKMKNYIKIEFPDKDYDYNHLNFINWVYNVKWYYIPRRGFTFIKQNF